jgi:hypothetical protein
MEHPDSPVARGPSALITHLQESVQAWIDSDRVLPADGAALLAALEHLQAELLGADAPAAQAGIAKFVDQVQTLIAAGLLEIGSNHSLFEARDVGCLAPARRGTDEETRGR